MTRPTSAPTVWYAGPPAGGRSSSSSWATSALISARTSWPSGWRTSLMASGLVTQVDSVLLDQIGVPLGIRLQLGEHLIAWLLQRRQAVLLIERLVRVGLERRLHAFGELVLHLLRGALRHRHEPVLRDLDVQALLLRGRHVGQITYAGGAKDAERQQLSRFDVLDRLADLQRRHVDLVAQQRRQGRCAAVERHWL